MSEPIADALFPERFVPGEMHGLIEAEHLVRYLWAGVCVPGRRVLDAGCGVGYGSLLLRAAGAAHVTGVDVAQEAVDAARQRTDGDVEFLRGDIAALPLEDASCDVAVCFEAIEHVQDQSRALDELRRVLTPDGLLVISSPNRDVYEEGNPHHTHEYSPGELLEALRERFSNVRLERQQAWLLSMICDDDALGVADPTRQLPVEVRKVAGIDPGRETFTLAIASDSTLPTPSAMAMVTGMDELTTWRQRARSAEEHLGRAEESARAASDAYRSAQDAYASAQRSYEGAVAALEEDERESARYQRELNRASTLLAERNAALRIATDELTRLRARAAELDATLSASSASLATLTSSNSWRLTAPLRALARAARRS